jgi:hypothetical protein
MKSALALSRGGWFFMTVGIILAFVGGWTVHIGADIYNMGTAWHDIGNDFYVVGGFVAVAGGVLIAAAVFVRRSGTHILKAANVRAN